MTQRAEQPTETADTASKGHFFCRMQAFIDHHGRSGRFHERLEYAFTLRIID
jgi:hypothetical protein